MSEWSETAEAWKKHPYRWRALIAVVPATLLFVASALAYRFEVWADETIDRLSSWSRKEAPGGAAERRQGGEQG